MPVLPSTTTRGISVIVARLRTHSRMLDGAALPAGPASYCSIRSITRAHTRVTPIDALRRFTRLVIHPLRYQSAVAHHVVLDGLQQDAGACPARHCRITLGLQQQLAARFRAVDIEIIEGLALGHEDFAAAQRVQRRAQRAEENEAMLHAHRPPPPALQHNHAAAAQPHIAQAPDICMPTASHKAADGGVDCSGGSCPSDPGAGQQAAAHFAALRHSGSGNERLREAVS